ncbi:protein of unknown function (DUF4174) [Cyclonatronum proteinivorum]|uniref:DUF4174 domain-containing protein n=1 Tax=Cyclonatronum proteinivorum TaxID=1457365 RepID=A0A345UHY0_9BACT|nr:DUF4174 domain-containing protein [Cyclonatronum proteinivorum]AXJ00082.1 protein of unknown function (DUF4174) [Cyclonatronum proteinivorum]
MLQFITMIFTTFFLGLFFAFADTPKSDSCEAVQDVTLEEFRWKYRLIVLTAPSASDHSFQQQLQQLIAEDAGLAERELRILALFQKGCSMLDEQEISSESASRVARQLEAGLSSFSFRLIGKDGGVKAFSDEMVSPEWLFGIIDRMPMRQREIRNR